MKPTTGSVGFDIIEDLIPFSLGLCVLPIGQRSLFFVRLERCFVLGGRIVFDSVGIEVWESEPPVVWKRFPVVDDLQGSLLPRRWLALHDVHVKHRGSNVFIEHGIAGCCFEIHRTKKIERWPIDDLEPPLCVPHAHHDDDQNHEGVEA